MRTSPLRAKQQGFTLVGVLILCAFMGAGALAYAELTSHAAQRDKEQELLFIGNQFRQAIGAYYERTPGPVKRFPQKLEELLEDRRHLVPQRHLRRLYADPMTGKRAWGLIEAPQGGIMGVHSLSEATPIKTARFWARDSTLEGTGRYSDWTFSYVAAPTLGSESPGHPESRPKSAPAPQGEK